MLDIKKLTFKYDNIPIFNNIEFQVNSGESVGIVGPNGCGKTTLLRLIAGLERATQGKIFIDNDSSKKHTILEINAFDRIGLIYDLTKKLYKLGFEISSAKILTLGKGANEIFYIQDFRGNKIISNKKIDKLKTSIMTLLKD